MIDFLIGYLFTQIFVVILIVISAKAGIFHFRPDRNEFIMLIMEILAQILGCLLLVMWLAYIPIARKHMRMRGEISHGTVFRFNILPFMVGLGLLLSGNWLCLLVGFALLFLSFPSDSLIRICPFYIPSFLLFIFPLVFGWIVGTEIFSIIYPYSKGWYFGGGAIGLLGMFILCTIVVAIVTTPPSCKDRKQQQ